MRRKRKAPATGAFSISKPPLLRRMDELSRRRDVVEAALHDLQRRGKASLLDLGLLHRYVRNTAAESAHLRRDWFDSTAGWWKDLPAVEPVLRAAFVKAGKLILKHKLPVDAYWMRGGERFQVVITKSAQQITMLFVTPDPRPIAKMAGVPRNLWVLAPQVR